MFDGLKFTVSRAAMKRGSMGSRSASSIPRGCSGRSSSIKPANTAGARLKTRNVFRNSGVQRSAETGGSERAASATLNGATRADVSRASTSTLSGVS